MTDFTPHLDPDLLSAYLDEEVTADERARVDNHLARCEACQVELDSLRWTVSLLNRLPVQAIPRTFYVTEAMIEPAPRQRSWWSLPARWQGLFAPLGAVAALLICFVIFQGQFVGGQPSSTTGSSAEIAVAQTMEVNERSIPSDDTSALSMEAPAASEEGPSENATEAYSVDEEAAAGSEPATEPDSAADELPEQAPAMAPEADVTEVAIPQTTPDEDNTSSASAAEPEATTVAVQDAPTVAAAEAPPVADVTGTDAREGEGESAVSDSAEPVEESETASEEALEAPAATAAPDMDIPQEAATVSPTPPAVLAADAQGSPTAGAEMAAGEAETEEVGSAAEPGQQPSTALVLMALSVLVLLVAGLFLWIRGRAEHG